MTPHAALAAIARPRTVAAAVERKKLEAEVARMVRQRGGSYASAAAWLMLPRRDITRVMAGRTSAVPVALLREIVEQGRG